jgi:hypothetical protein
MKLDLARFAVSASVPSPVFVPAGLSLIFHAGALSSDQLTHHPHHGNHHEMTQSA